MIYKVKEIHGNLIYILLQKEIPEEKIAVLSGKMRIHVNNTFNIPLRHPCCVGDLVKVKESSESEYPLIIEILERKNILMRSTPYEIHFLGSNLDRAVLVASLIYPLLNTGFIDRFLISCLTANIKPFIIFSKCDLIDLDNSLHEQLLSQSFYYSSLFKNVYYGNLNFLDDKKSFQKVNGYYQKKYGNSHSLKSIKDFFSEIQQGITIFNGMSGVGKSTMVNQILGKKVQKTLEISRATGKGKHATTKSTLFVVSRNSSIIDTPGLKELGLYHLTKKQIVESYPEWQYKLGNCKFRNCEHVDRTEGCVIQEELRSKKIPNWRKHNLQSILNSLDFYERIRAGDYKKPTGRFYNSK